MTNTDWWAKRLSSQTPRPSTPPISPTQNTPYKHEFGAPNTQVAYNSQTDELVSKAQSAKQQARCPGCNSGNYMAVQGSKSRCYDCGYPLVQAGTGVGLPSQSSGPAIAAKQPNQGNGFNPTTIVGRLE